MTTATNTTKTNRDQWLPKVRVTQAELHAIKQKARDAGLTVSEYKRRALLERVVVVRQNVHDVQAIRQLAAIGNNLNQLTRKTHIHDEYTRERLHDILNAIEAWIDEAV